MKAGGIESKGKFRGIENLELPETEGKMQMR